MTELNWTNVDRIIKACLLDDVKDVESVAALAALDGIDAVKAVADDYGIVIVESTMQHIGFVKERLEAHRAEVVDMLSQLEDSFFVGHGGGMSLMQMVATKDGTLWGEQWQADLLFSLAKGLGLADFTLPRDMWPSLPGAMPYITITN